jgi:hypothetical protein
MQRPNSPFGNKVVIFEGDFWQCPPMVSRGSWAAIISASFLRSVLWRQVHVLTFMENMRLHANPFSRPYVKYLLRVDNSHHQAPSLDTLIHVVFPALAINYANQGYMDGWAILTTKNTVMNSFNTQIAEAMPELEHVFLSTYSVETRDD